ncbi:Rv1733c family protein [Mycobacterium sp. NPDC003449]
MGVSVFGRWWVLRALGGNPLVRRIDRTEAIAVLLAIAVAVLVIPSAVGIGEDAYGANRRTAIEQEHTRTPAQATVVSNSEPTVDGAPVSMVKVKWTYAGSERTGMIGPSRSVRAGDHVQIWLDQQGRRVPAPISESTAAAYAIGAAVAAWLGTVVLCVLAIAGMRRLLNHYRFQAWSSDLRELLDSGDGRTKWPI